MAIALRGHKDRNAWRDQYPVKFHRSISVSAAIKKGITCFFIKIHGQGEVLPFQCSLNGCLEGRGTRVRFGKSHLHIDIGVIK